MVRVKRSDLQARGVNRVLGRVTGVHDGRPVVDGVGALDVANVVWCTGFRQVFDWIDVPIFGADGWPREMRGVVSAAPGLFFCGLASSTRPPDGVAWGRQGCRLHCEADRHSSREVILPRSLSRLARTPLSGRLRNGRRAGQDHR